jgi:hypothetical protein
MVNKLCICWSEKVDIIELHGAATKIMYLCFMSGIQLSRQILYSGDVSKSPWPTELFLSQKPLAEPQIKLQASVLQKYEVTLIGK